MKYPILWFSRGTRREWFEIELPVCKLVIHHFYTLAMLKHFTFALHLNTLTLWTFSTRQTMIKKCSSR